MFLSLRAAKAAVVAWLVFSLPALAHACSSCGCSFNSEWSSEGYTNSSGLRFDVRFDLLDQDQLRRNSRGVSKESFNLPNEEEIQQRTITRETLLGLDYSPDRFWGIHLLLPTVDRTHTTIAPGDIDTSGSASQGIGDAQVIGRYQGFSSLAHLGVQIGLKAPTGKFTDNFRTGPQTGESLDRGLQNGSGTTDAILGAYYFDVLAPQFDYFTQVTGNQPFAERDGFMPGTSVTASAGIDYQATQRIKPQLQVNYHFETREIGEEADYDNSGGHFIELTPGITVAVAKGLDVFSLVQVPIYQRVNGLQLETRSIISVGLRYAL